METLKQNESRLNEAAARGIHAGCTVRFIVKGKMYVKPVSKVDEATGFIHIADLPGIPYVDPKYLKVVTAVA